MHVVHDTQPDRGWVLVYYSSPVHGVETTRDRFIAVRLRCSNPWKWRCPLCPCMGPVGSKSHTCDRHMRQTSMPVWILHTYTIHVLVHVLEYRYTCSTRVHGVRSRVLTRVRTRVVDRYLHVWHSFKFPALKNSRHFFGWWWCWCYCNIIQYCTDTWYDIAIWPYCNAGTGTRNWYPVEYYIVILSWSQYRYTRDGLFFNIIIFNMAYVYTPVHVYTRVLLLQYMRTREHWYCNIAIQ